MMSTKTFCIAPWAHVCVKPTGHLAPCCVWKGATSYKFNEYSTWRDSTDMQLLRKNLNDGVQVSGCEQCWKDESIGRQSLRQIYNKESYKHFDKKSINDKWLTDDAVALDLKLGNLCNLKCIMCNGNSSSQLMSEYKNNSEKFTSLDFFKPPSVEIDFEWPLTAEFGNFLQRFNKRLTWIKFTGGEPTIIPYVLQTLEQIQHPELVTVSLTTNATRISTRLIETLYKFKAIWLSISIDGITEHNNQIRHLSLWPEIESNIFKLSKLPNVYLNINYVLQCFSVYTLVPLLQWCEQHHLKMDLLVLSTPDYLSVNSVDPPVVEKFICELKALKIVDNQQIVQQVLDFLKQYRYDPILKQQREQYLQTINEIRGTDLGIKIKEII